MFFFSLAPWLPGLEGELQASSGAGSAIRLDVLTQGFGTLRERVLPIEQGNEDGPRTGVATCVVLQDSDLDYFLLTAAGEQPQAATLDAPYDQLNSVFDDFPHRDFEPEMKLLALGPTRAAYQPPMSLFEDLSFGSSFLDKHQDTRHKWTRTQEIRLSGATLQLMTEAHRVLSEQTQQLGAAAADLFRRCERMQDEFRDQIRRANEVANRIDSLTDVGEDDYDAAETEEEGQTTTNTFIEKRLDKAKARQEELKARHEALRRKLARSGRRDLSEKEEVWISEIEKLGHSVLEEEAEEGDEQQRQEIWQRYKEASHVAHAPVGNSLANNRGTGTGTGERLGGTDQRYLRRQSARTQRILQSSAGLEESKARPDHELAGKRVRIYSFLARSPAVLDGTDLSQIRSRRSCAIEA